MPVGLRLKSYSDVFDRRGEKGVGDAGHGSRGVVLTVGERWVCGTSAGIRGFEASTGLVEGTELDRDLRKGHDLEDRK